MKHRTQSIDEHTPPVLRLDETAQRVIAERLQRGPRHVDAFYFKIEKWIHGKNESEGRR